MDELQEIFDRGNNQLIDHKISDFVKSIEELNEKLTCNCFLKKLNKNVLEKQLEVIDNIEDDSNNYDVNIAKGWVYLLNKKMNAAYEYLTLAIQLVENEDINMYVSDKYIFVRKLGWHLNSSKGDISRFHEYFSTRLNPKSGYDLPYALRYRIDVGINPNRSKDANRAVKLNPSARNYFLYANMISDRVNSTKDDINKFFNKAIELHPNFPCAYRNKGIYLHNNRSYHSAIESFQKCIELKPDYGTAYINLCLSLISNCNYKTPDFSEIIKVAKEGLLRAPNLKNLWVYNLVLGYSNFRLNKFGEALKYLNNIFLHYSIEQLKKEIVPFEQKFAGPFAGDCKLHLFVNELIMACKNELTRIEANQAFLLEEFGKAREKYEAYFKQVNPHTLVYRGILKWQNIYKEMNCYISSLIKSINPPVQIDESNAMFKRLDKLLDSYLWEDQACHLEEDARNRKLIIYGGDDRLGFGKYPDYTINNLINIDSEYLIWCIINLEYFTIAFNILINAKLIQEPLYAKAIECFEIKSLLIKKWRPESENDIDDYDTYELDSYYEPDYSDINGDWGGLYGEEAFVGYWNTH